MFDIGIQELVLIFLVALLVFGPKRLPELGKTLGKFMFEIKKGIGEAKSQMEDEFREIEKGRDVQPEEQAAGDDIASGKGELKTLEQEQREGKK